MLTLAATLALAPGTPGVSSTVPHVQAAPPAMFDTQRRFSPAAAALPEGAPEHLILEKLRAGEPQQAVDIARNALMAITQAAPPSVPVVGTNPAADAAWDCKARIQWLLARALSEAEREREAEMVLRELVSARHPLSPWARLRLGTIELKHNAEQALTTLSPLLENFADAARARQLYALALARCDRGSEALPRLRALVDEAPAHQSAATVAMPLAELLEKRGSVPEQLEALALYRRVASRAPQTSVGRQARQLAHHLLRSLPGPVRAKHARPSVEDSFALGDALLRERAYQEAADQFERLSHWVKDDSDLRCKADLERGRALLRKRERKQGAELMAELAERCQDVDVRAWAHYSAGRARFRLDDASAALAHYDALPEVAPGHRLADDGLYQGALAAADLDDEAGMTARLQTLVDDHPDGDMRTDGMFVLAWRAYKEDRHADALIHFDRLLSEGPGEEDEGIEGRAAYWRARSLARLGRKRAAADGYVALVEDRPLSYHARQALARLDEIAPARANKLRRTLLKRDKAHAPVTFAHRPEMDDPTFTGAIALLQVGEFDRARDAFRHIGATGPKADKEQLWLVAALYDAAGAYAQASALSRYRLSDFMHTAPKGRNFGLWRIAYPNAFAPLIERAAAEAKVPAAFVRAVAREESAFNPEAVSHAHAYGLIQLIRPTAREHAAALGLPSHPAALKRPEVNLWIGAHFIRFLWSRYQDNPAVVPAAYNAGHGAAQRWMQQTPDAPLDEWIESIPYQETRRYTRRVLQTYGVYSWLETGKLPPLKKRLPRR